MGAVLGGPYNTPPFRGTSMDTMVSNLEQRRAQQFGTPKSVPVQRLRVGKLDRTQRGGGSGKGALEMGHPSLWELFQGNLEGCSFVRGPEGYERKALGMSFSPHGSSVGPPGVGSSTGDFEIWLTGALRVGCLSLWELC